MNGGTVAVGIAAAGLRTDPDGAIRAIAVPLPARQRCRARHRQRARGEARGQCRRIRRGDGRPDRGRLAAGRTGQARGGRRRGAERAGQGPQLGARDSG